MNRNVSINELMQSGKYEQEFLQNIMRSNFEVVGQLPVEKRSNRHFMEPLLYAVKNDLKTYQIYKYCGENIQKDITIATEVVKSEPNLIKGTPLCNDKEFILNNASICPVLIQYIGPELKKDTEFVKELNKISNQPINQISEWTTSILNNPELRNDKLFISNAMNSDISFLKYASENLKNDFEFLKEQASKNEKVIDFVVDNVKDFGLEGIKAVRESSKDFTINDCLTLIDEMAKNSTDERYGKVKAKVEEKGINDIHVMKWVTAMVAQRNDLNPELVKKVLNYSILTMEKTKQDLTLDGKMHVNIENTQALITPSIIHKLKENLEKQGIDVDEQIKEKIESYNEFYDDYYSQFKEQKKQNNRQNISLSQIQDATKNVKTSDIQLMANETKNLIRNEERNNVSINNDEISR